MAQEVYVERRRRGFFGWIFLLIFIGWNVLMIVWLVAAGSGMSEVMQGAGSQAEQAGAAVGAGLGFMFILFIWAMGAVVTGLLALLTRGSKTVVTRRR